MFDHGLRSMDIPTLVDCDCKATVWNDKSGVEIEYCPTHEAAPDLKQQNRDLVAALGRLVLAFDIGDMAHTTLNGRGYSALADARPLLDIGKEE